MLYLKADIYCTVLYISMQGLSLISFNIDTYLRLVSKIPWTWNIFRTDVS